MICSFKITKEGIYISFTNFEELSPDIHPQKNVKDWWRKQTKGEDKKSN